MDTYYANEQETLLELISNKIQNYNEDQILTCITQQEEKWHLNCQGDRMIPLKIGFMRYYNQNQLDVSTGLPIDLDIEHVSENHKRTQHGFSSLYHRSKSLGISDNISEDINGNEFKVSNRINRLIESSDDAYESVFRYARQFERINHPTYVPINPDADHTRFRKNPLDIENITPYQNLLLALLKNTYEMNYRRYKGACCSQIKTIDGHYTKAWKAIMPVSEFVYEIAQKETNGDVWKDLTQKAANARDATRHLTECKDMQFPEIKKNRNYWSFSNGIFASKLMSSKDESYYCKFFPYESEEYRCLDPCIVSSKFFDQPFNKDYIDTPDWYDIPTPHFQGILDYQKFETDVCKWMYVLGGRLCYDVGELDGWQIIPFLKGIAMSGKSTIITKVFKKFYESDDVRTLSNNIERKFGLSSIYDGFMFIAPEVKGDMCLEQAEFQSLVSGEDVSLARKYEKAKSIEWKTPGILAGNEVPNWKDNSGSVLRRIMPFNFCKKVMEADPHLDEKLNKELPVIMLKCIRAYLEYSHMYSDQDIWNVVPKYFKTIQTQVAMVTNSLQHFLASEKVKYDKELYCPQNVFQQAFNTHCSENNLGRHRFNPDFYMGPFSSRDIEVRVESVKHKGTNYPNQPIIYGLDIVEYIEEFNENY
jgi:hypothetical protein